MKAMNNHTAQPVLYLRHSERAHGFTLIELMISMAMGLLILAGISAMFVSYGKTSTAVSSRTERMGDLYLATQIMQGDLRMSALLTGSIARPADLASRGVSLPGDYPTTFASGLPFWDATTKTLTYQDQDGNTGIFHYQRTSNDRVYWLRPDDSYYRFQELIRDLDTSSGMTVSTSSGVWIVTLNSAYEDEARSSKNMTLSFNTWPRN
jgi:prepilin-type N-terminal cleavage/methylation domain-containing protein